jgi:hypothetical protein
MFLALLLAIQLAPSGPSEHYMQPQIAVHGGVVGVTFGSGTTGSGTTVYYSGSRDHGKTFSTPVKVVESATRISLGMHRGPRIAITPGAVVITAAVQNKDGRDGNLVAWRSTDGGKTWSEGVVVNDIPTAAREGLQGMAAGDNGMLYAAWLDDRSIEDGPRRKKLFGASSRDGGKTWSKNTLIYRSSEGPDAKICECCHPSVAIDSHGRIYVMFRNNLAGARDMYLSHSDDGGATFSQAQKLGQGSWPVNGCPMDGGGLSIDRENSVISIWRRQDTIYMHRAAQPEVIVAKGKNPAIATGKDGAYAVWSGASGLMAKIPGSQEPIALADEGGYPSLVTVGSSVLAAWESKGKIVIRDLSAEQLSARRGK